MKIRRFDGSNEDYKLLHDICYGCNSNTMKQTYAYIRRAEYQGGKKFFCDIFDECAFFCGIRAKDHTRCIAIAAMESNQRKSLGRAILAHEKKKAKVFGSKSITLRTSRKENGVKFWLAMGARITGKKGEDWEMTLLLL